MVTIRTGRWRPKIHSVDGARVVTQEQIEKRKRVMQRSIALGHCICDPRKPCPCDVFKQQGYCHCAGEHPKALEGPVRLTEHVRNAGCASKISKDVLKEVLSGLPEIDDPRVVVGASAGDDAGVMMISPDTATILTVDVFCPSVDDPYTFGQIAAANSLSDIYAMGGEPQAALSIIGFPVHSLPTSAMREILRGGLDKMKEAGVPVIGGHSINDEEVKCGFAVVGTSPKDAYIRNAGARPGDLLVLTKPLGGGIVAFARQIGKAPAGAMDELGCHMATLNRAAGGLMVRHGAHAATDVTGFSLMGHLAEIVKNSNVEVMLDFDAIPLFSGVQELADQEVLPGALERNRESVDPAMLDLAGLSPGQQGILFCPETSGGMLVCLPEDAACGFVRDMHAQGVTVTRVIGQVTGPRPGGVIRARSRKGISAVAPLEAVTPAAEASCCSSAQPAEAATPTVEASCCCSAQPTAPASAQPASTKPAGRDDLPPAPAAGDAFKAYMAEVNAPGALGTKQKKLIALALSVMGKCEPCVKINTRAARDAGASEQEIAEAAALGIAFGGAPVAMFYNTLRQSR
jgi:selenide, water dikinase